MFKKKYPCVMQLDSADCGVACAATIIEYYGAEYSQAKIHNLIGTNREGTSASGIIEGFKSLNFDAVGIKVKAEDITTDMTLPAIAQIRIENLGFHFVVIYKKNKSNKFIVADPAVGILEMDYLEFEKKFTGVLIIASPNENFEMGNFKSKNSYLIFANLIFTQKKLFIISICASVVLTILNIFISTFSKIMVDEVIMYQLSNRIVLFCVVFGITHIVSIILDAFRKLVIAYIGRKIDINVLMGYFEHIINLPYMFFTNRRTGDLLTRMQDANTIKNIFTEVSLSLVLDTILSLIIGIILFSINSTLFFVLLFSMLIDIMLVFAFKKSYRNLNHDSMNTASEFNSSIIETIENFEMVKTNNIEDARITKIENSLVSTLKVGYKKTKVMLLHLSLSRLAINMGDVVFWGIAASLIINQKITFGDMLLFQSLSVYFSGPIQNIVNLQLSWQEAAVAMERLNELSEIDREDKNDTGINLSRVLGNISLRDVTFAYGNRRAVLNDITMHIPMGSKIGIVGESGAGKTTIAKLLLRLMELDNGNIYIDNVNIKNINKQFLRNNIAYITQNINILRGSILDNIKLGNPKLSNEQIIEICQKYEISSFIDELPGGYYTFIEEDGMNLSGGEKQRISILRGLVKIANIYIFDESTSNLDAYNEMVVQKLIYEELKDKTCIIIAHRLSTISRANCIMLLKNGKVIDQGTHEELILKNPEYSSLVEFQNIQ